MKRLLLILLCSPFMTLGQQTYVPDDSFETYLESAGMGNGIPNDDYVTTANIDTVTSLSVSQNSISDLTGIEDFISLQTLWLSPDSLQSIDLSSNIALEYLDINISYNSSATPSHYIDSIDLSNNINLIDVYIDIDAGLVYLGFSNHPNLKSIWLDDTYIANINFNGMPSLEEFRLRFNSYIKILDFSNNPMMKVIDCEESDSLIYFSPPPSTQLLWIDIHGSGISGTLDLSQNTGLMELKYSVGPLGYNDPNFSLTGLNLKNGNNLFTSLEALSPYLTCIEVDDSTWATNNWLSTIGSIWPGTVFSHNCNNTTVIEEHFSKLELFKVTDLLGRETKQTNQPLFYIYDDGTVEKRIVIE